MPPRKKTSFFNGRKKVPIKKRTFFAASLNIGLCYVLMIKWQHFMGGQLSADNYQRTIITGQLSAEKY